MSQKKEEFPWYCSYGGPIGIAACPRKDLPWYCYMGAVGKNQCVKEGLIDADPVTTIVDGAENLVGGALWAAQHLDTILIGASIVGGGIGILWVTKTLKELNR